MLYWGIFMFLLGALAFLDSFFNYGQIFRMVNSIFFMLLALGVLLRTRILMGKGFIEKLIERNESLEQQLEHLNISGTVEEKDPEMAK